MSTPKDSAISGELFKQEGDLRQHRLTVHAPKHKSERDRIMDRFKELDERYTTDQVSDPQSTSDGPILSPPEHRHSGENSYNAASPGARRRRLRRTDRPTQGDFVLIRVMDPNRPDIALSVGQRALREEGGPDTSVDDTDDETENQKSTAANAAVDNAVVPCCCGICGELFERTEDLRQHRLRTHPREHTCDHDGCKKAFITSKGLNLHRKIHDTNKKPSKLDDELVMGIGEEKISQDTYPANQTTASSSNDQATELKSPRLAKTSTVESEEALVDDTKNPVSRDPGELPYPASFPTKYPEVSGARGINEESSGDSGLYMQESPLLTFSGGQPIAAEAFRNNQGLAHEQAIRQQSQNSQNEVSQAHPDNDLGTSRHKEKSNSLEYGRPKDRWTFRDVEIYLGVKIPWLTLGTDPNAEIPEQTNSALHSFPDNLELEVMKDDQAAIRLDSTAEPAPLDQDNDTGSIFSSYADSIFSIQSLETSATDLSKSSDYSTTQIATATRELVLIFHTDQMLVPLYLSALDNPSIGEERLERNLRRLFKSYARSLEEEASDMVEHLASKLVAAKSRYLARSILEKFAKQETPTQRYISEIESSDEEETSKKPINEDAFEDLGHLAVYRDFLTESQAFHTLRHQISSFVRPSTGVAENCETGLHKGDETLIQDSEPINHLSRLRVSVGTVISWMRGRDFGKIIVPPRVRTIFMTGNQHIEALSTAAKMLMRDVYIATGELEHPQEPGPRRLRWTCRCGEKLYGDVNVLQPGGLELLKSQMARSSGAQFDPDGVRSVNSGQSHIYNPPFSWVKRGVGKFFGSMRQSSQQTLPTSKPCPSVATQGSHCPPMSNQILYMMACMRQGRRGKNLRQERIESVSTDRQLFHFLRHQYARHRGKLKTVLTLRGIQEIFFVKFRLPVGGSVEIRLHETCCRGPACECLPPESMVEPAPQAEYRCRPIPPQTSPPVLPEYMAHLFASPECINEHDTWILDQLPKRNCGQLHGKSGEPAEGWGIYYQEGWDRDKITLISFVVFLLGSLTFGILWSIYKMDVQGAFGVAAYMVTFCALLLAFVSTRESM